MTTDAARVVLGGYRPGVLGWVVAQHASHYAQLVGFGDVFEAKVASEMAEFLTRRDDPGCGMFVARDGADDSVLGSCTIDWERDAPLAHFRWFIVADAARGRGVGRLLLGAAIARAREAGAPGVYLDTFAGLDAARRLYEAVGFRLVSEAEAETWGLSVREQRFELRFAT